MAWWSMRIITSKRGMGLVTVMVSMAMLTIALVAATSAFISASKLTKHAACMTSASNFAEGVMERTRSRPFASIRTASVTNGLPKLPQAECSIAVAVPESGLKDITVTCSWVEHSVPYHVRFSTLVAGGGR